MDNNFLQKQKGFSIEDNLKTTYIATLPHEKQESIRSLLNDLNLTNLEITEAMDSRVCDLEDTLNIQYKSKKNFLLIKNEEKGFYR